MQLQEKRGHAEETGDGDDEERGGCFAFDGGVVLGGVVEECKGLLAELEALISVIVLSYFSSI